MTVVITVGHPYRGDDGAGPAVAEALRRRAPDLRIIEADGEPTRILDAWEGEDMAIVVDAVRTAAAAPGTVHRLAPASPGDRPTGSHSLGLGEAYALAEALGRLPARLVVYGIEAASFGLGAPLSPPVAAAVDGVIDMVLADLRGTAGG